MTVEELRKILATRPPTDKVWIFSAESGDMAKVTDVDDSRHGCVWINARPEGELL